LTSPLGGLLDRISSNLNTIKFNQIPPDIRIILQKNGFLSHFGYARLIDANNTTIQYLKLKPTDGRFFNQYVVSELLERPELPDLSAALKKKIIESIYEIFINAQIHSETDFIYTCGQFFPKKNKIEFSITDTGVGFQKKVNDRFNCALSPIQAIKWAIGDGNSTKKDISGGIGLAILKEFVIQNRGKIQIISGNGFYQLGENNEEFKEFAGSFPGTIINMQFNTNDKNSYVLAGEFKDDDIF
jgi:hypothetical protein